MEFLSDLTTPLNPPSAVERTFIGLVREYSVADFVGRATQLTDEELRSVFALAEVALRRAARSANARESAEPRGVAIRSAEAPAAPQRSATVAPVRSTANKETS